MTGMLSFRGQRGLEAKFNGFVFGLIKLFSFSCILWSRGLDNAKGIKIVRSVITLVRESCRPIPEI